MGIVKKKNPDGILSGFFFMYTKNTGKEARKYLWIFSIGENLIDKRGHFDIMKMCTVGERT